MPEPDPPPRADHGAATPEDITATPHDRRAQNREILRLAIPAFLALVAEPIFLLTDSAIVGHLGTVPLAGLGVASAALLTAAGVFVFLAYGTTAVVARRLGAGDLRGALSAGMDGVWLAVLIGVVTAVLTAVLAEPIVGWFGASPEATAQAATYLRVSAASIPALLVVLAATGVLRGLQDTRTPLVVAVVGFSANAVLSLAFVHGLQWGIAGAAWGTVVAQGGMAVALFVVMLRGARRHGARLRPHVGGVLRAALGGVPLLIRTLALRATMLLTTAAAAGLGDTDLAAFQVTMTIWSALAFALDALAIAAQALTGRALGAGDVTGTRSVTITMLRWGVWFGAALTLLILALHRVAPAAFTSDADVRAAIAAGLIVVALGQPIAGVAFVLDGVLIGAGDARWLAYAQVVFLVAYLPMIGAVVLWGPDATAGLVWLWIAFSGFMAVRAAGLWWRFTRDAWLVTGATR